MSELVRARLDGVDSTMARFFAEKYEAEILDEPTHGLDGSVRGETSAVTGREAKPHTSVNKAAAAKRAAAMTTAPVSGAETTVAKSAETPKE